MDLEKLFSNLINRLPNHIVAKLESTEQDDKYHAEGNVLIHTKMVFTEVFNCEEVSLDLLVAAIFHDLGKIDTHKEWVDKTGRNRISHITHEMKSMNYIDKYINLFDDVTTDVDLIKEVVGSHMRAHLYLSGKMSRPAKRKTFEDLVYFKEIITFTGCDERGRISK